MCRESGPGDDITNTACFLWIVVDRVVMESDVERIFR